MRPIMTRLLIVQALVLLLHFPTKTNSQNGPLLLICPPDSNYTIPSPFKTNLDNLLSTLVTSTSTSSALFSNATLGLVYGLAQCRPDASVADCASCLNRSISTISSLCSLRRSAATRFDLCLLRYSDHRFFSQLANDTPGIISNGNDAANQSVHDRQLKSLMDKISSEAPKSSSRYAVGVTNSAQSQLIYGMVQCTRDLSVDDCARCLDEEVGLFPTNGFGKVGAQVFRMSCTARFESYPFFSLSVLPPQPPPPPPPPPLPPPSATIPVNNSGIGSTVRAQKKTNTMTIILAIVIPLVVAFNLLLLATFCYLWRRAIRKAHQGGGGIMNRECLMFDLGTLRDATENFTDANKLGEGGFGPVYKGELKDGQEIAVKRFFGTSAARGLVELKNEVAFLAKLQHKNLVKLFGCCLEEEEKLLVYEYLPNTSLDRYLFDPVRCEQLDWITRFKIIEGTSRGLVYLHEDSRLKIIHRDLKASNILLDKDMNPKISDFGIAKLFGMDETQGSTSRIAGTYGYMAPEYAILGRYSNKSDVIVSVLLIVTGRKNSGFQRNGNDVDLLTYIWHHWNEGTALQLKDPNLGDDCQAEQVLRCINIGLLCVQEDPNERPNMVSVVLMLNSYLPLPSPSRPVLVGGGSTTTVPLRDKTPDVQHNEQFR
ncbi:Non-specific serine/threonine protein kinase protein [Dioscorea alata]|uniref:Non-specific serine/threonine protein kinase protein n=1 Tax=Dioscorea alata TaxID=55571 RepID=A0ACB7UP59_DIOAL|nr:Non-specific serine/threonine protein kinase protein [Dioscorea alata]